MSMNSEVQNTEGIDDVVLASGKSLNETVEFYKDWSVTYENDVENLEGGYQNPHRAADCLIRFLHDKSSKILDVGCGTGLVAIDLRSRGYENIDGLDGSEEMLALAKKRDLYHNYFLELVGEDKMTNVEDASYDAVVTAGTILPDHMTHTCLRTLGRAVRSGGIICITLRESVLQHPELSQFEPQMNALVEEGFWNVLHQATFDNCFGNHPGIEYAIKKL